MAGVDRIAQLARAPHAEATKCHKPTTLGSIALGGIAGVLDSDAASAALCRELFEVAKKPFLESR